MLCLQRLLTYISLVLQGVPPQQALAQADAAMIDLQVNSFSPVPNMRHCSHTLRPATVNEHCCRCCAGHEPGTGACSQRTAIIPHCLC
jgi:hypothetical protein